MAQLAKNVADDLRIFLPGLMDATDTSAKATEHRYMTFGVMEKAGYTHQQIADYFKVNRETVTKGLSKLDVWLGVYSDMAGTYNRLQVLALNNL